MGSMEFSGKLRPRSRITPRFAAASSAIRSCRHSSDRQLCHDFLRPPGGFWEEAILAECRWEGSACVCTYSNSTCLAIGPTTLRNASYLQSFVALTGDAVKDFFETPETQKSQCFTCVSRDSGRRHPGALPSRVQRDAGTVDRNSDGEETKQETRLRAKILAGVAQGPKFPTAKLPDYILPSPLGQKGRVRGVICRPTVPSRLRPPQS